MSFGVEREMRRDEETGQRRGVGDTKPEGEAQRAHALPTSWPLRQVTPAAAGPPATQRFAALRPHRWIAWTESGRSYFSPAVDSHPDAARIAAHEAVHAAQHRAAAVGHPVGGHRALEAEAERGASTLLRGDPFAPALAAPPGLVLGYGEEWLPDPAAVSDREVADLATGGFDPARSAVQVETSSTLGAPGEPSEAHYRVEIDGAGSHGSVISTTEIVVRHDPGVRVTVTSGPQIRQVDPETGLFPAEDRPAYPFTISYVRHVVYTDDEGRSAELDVDGQVWFSEHQWQAALGSVAVPSFERLLALEGDEGAMRTTLTGTGPVTSYFWLTEVTAASLAGQIGTTASGIAGGSRSAAASVTPDVPFVAPDLTAARQHESIHRLLGLEDVAVVIERLSSQGGVDASNWLDQALAALEEWLTPVADALDELGEGIWDALPSWLQDELVAFGELVASLAAELAPLVEAIDALAHGVGEWWDALPPWARGVLKAVGAFVGGLAVVSLLAGLVVLAAEGAVAFGTAMLIIGAIALGVGYVMSMVHRIGEAWDAGSPLAMMFVSTVALLDVVGISGLYEAITNTSILTGRDLGMSEEQRWEVGTTGGLQLGTLALGALVVGARGFRGGRVPTAALESVEVTFTGSRTGFDALPASRLPLNLPEGYAWRRSGGRWELVRDPAVGPHQVEISTFDDGTGSPSYVTRLDGQPIHTEAFTRPPNDPHTGTQRLPAEMEGRPVEQRPVEQQPPAGYDPTSRTDAQLRLDTDPTLRPGEIPQQAAERVQAANSEIGVRRVMAVYDALGDEPPQLNVAANDKAHQIVNGAHTLDRHGPNLPLRRGVPGARTVEGRIYGDPPWVRPENWSYRWIDDSTMNRCINDFVRTNWEGIRSDLTLHGEFEGTFNAGNAVGEGFFNRGMYGAGARVARYHRTSLFTLRLRLIPGSNPPRFFIVTAFPSGT